MKTQRLNLLEAINFALAGHEVKSYKDGYTIKLKKGNLAVYHKDFSRGVIPRGIKLDADFIRLYKNEEWYAGDDKTIKGYYEEE